MENIKRKYNIGDAVILNNGVISCITGIRITPKYENNIVVLNEYMLFYEVANSQSSVSEAFIRGRLVVEKAEDL